MLHLPQYWCTCNYEKSTHSRVCKFLLRVSQRLDIYAIEWSKLLVLWAIIPVEFAMQRYLYFCCWYNLIKSWKGCGGCGRAKERGGALEGDVKDVWGSDDRLNRTREDVRTRGTEERVQKWWLRVGEAGSVLNNNGRCPNGVLSQPHVDHQITCTKWWQVR